MKLRKVEGAFQGKPHVTVYHKKEMFRWFDGQDMARNHLRADAYIESASQFTPLPDPVVLEPVTGTFFGIQIPETVSLYDNRYVKTPYFFVNEKPYHSMYEALRAKYGLVRPFDYQEVYGCHVYYNTGHPRNAPDVQKTIKDIVAYFLLYQKVWQEYYHGEQREQGRWFGKPAYAKISNYGFSLVLDMRYGCHIPWRRLRLGRSILDLKKE